MKYYFLPFFGVPCCKRLDLNEVMRQALSTKRLAAAQNPSQAEMIFIIGQVTQKQAPHLQNLWAKCVYPAFSFHIAGCEKKNNGYAIVDDLRTVIRIDHQLDTCELDSKKLESEFAKMGKKK